jgi:hypothetical protein
LEATVIAFKNRKIYKVNVATPSRTQLDYSNGGVGGRAIVRVENEVFFQNNAGVYTLAQRQNLVGSFRAESLTNDIQELTDSISPAYLENTSAIYVPELKNVYFFCDLDGTGVNEGVLVYSILAKKWTRYTGIAANEGVIWEDSTGEPYFLVANAVTGQVREIEYGTDDNGNEINASVLTKNWTFNLPEQLKTFEGVDIFGFITEGSQIQFNILVDGEDRTGDIFVNGDDYVTESASGYAYALKPLGASTYGGGTSSSSTTVTYYPFKIRIPMYATGSTVQIQAQNTLLDSQWQLTKAALYPYGQPLDVYPNEFIA